MPALVAGIHVFRTARSKTWMAGTSPAMTRQCTDLNSSRSSLLARRHAFERQLLHSGGGLREIDIAFGIGRDVVARSQNAGRLDRAHHIERLAIDDANAFVTAHIQ